MVNMAKVVDNIKIERMIEKDMTLSQFVWFCAPELDELRLDWVGYERRQLEKAVEHYQFLDSMPLTDRISYITKIQTERIQFYQESVDGGENGVKKCKVMLIELDGWEPTTPEHVELKAEMKSRLEEKIGNTSTLFEFQLDECKNLNLIEAFDRELLTAKTVVACCEDNVRKAEEKAERNKFLISELVKTFGVPPVEI